MAAKKSIRAKASKVTRAKATKKSSIRAGRKAPGVPPVSVRGGLNTTPIPNQ
jgi:hypothetical protein